MKRKCPLKTNELVYHFTKTIFTGKIINPKTIIGISLGIGVLRTITVDRLHLIGPFFFVLFNAFKLSLAGPLSYLIRNRRTKKNTGECKWKQKPNVWALKYKHINFVLFFPLSVCKVRIGCGRGGSLYWEEIKTGSLSLFRLFFCRLFENFFFFSKNS